MKRCITCDRPLPKHKILYCTRDCYPKHYCIDCSKEVSCAGTKRCKSCAKKGANNPNWRGGYVSFCIGCGKKLAKSCNKRCHSCACKHPEFRQKQSEARKGKKLSKETRRKISESNKGRVKSEEHCRNLSISLKASFANIDRSGENNANWRGGLSFEPYGLSFNNELKNQIRERENYKCFICWLAGKDERNLSIHHINYDKVDNRPSNLVALCIPCHVKTNGNRNYWQKILTDLVMRRYDVKAVLNSNAYHFK